MGAELIFIPSPGAGHLMSTIEIAKLLTSLDKRLSITVLIMKSPFDTGETATTQSLQKDAPNAVVFVELPQPGPPVSKSKSPLLDLIQSQTTQVGDYVRQNCNGYSKKLAAFVIDMFCTPMIDVANEFSVPTYMFFTSGAAFLGLQFYQLKHIDEHNKELFEYKDSNVELSVPSYINPVPVKVLPSVMMTHQGSTIVQKFSRRFKEVKALLVNTFMELEPHAIKSLADDCTIPPVYHVGPIINLDKKEGNSKNKDSEDGIISWLDNQPPCSVVFLCFGSFGSFEEGQVREIANGLEQSGHRFLWSLRRSPAQAGRMELPKDYEDPSEVLPEGFLERMSGIGKVIGWAPQVAILSHIAVGGFVSHCGWNSTLESIWCGVPIAAWPLYAEQQMNAFELVRDLGMAVEIKMDYRKKDAFSDPTMLVEIVTADEIARGIRRLMDGESEIRKKMKDMKEMSRMAVAESGSSYVLLKHFIEEVVGDIQESV